MELLNLSDLKPTSFQENEDDILCALKVNHLKRIKTSYEPLITGKRKSSTTSINSLQTHIPNRLTVSFARLIVEVVVTLSKSYEPRYCSTRSYTKSVRRDSTNRPSFYRSQMMKLRSLTITLQTTLELNFPHLLRFWRRATYKPFSTTKSEYPIFIRTEEIANYAEFMWR